MAYRIPTLCSLANSVRQCFAVSNGNAIDLLKPRVPLVQYTRDTSFFNRRPADLLWKSVTSVSNAGRRRGRAKGLGRKKDLNRGQIIGVGKIPMRFPGLNSPIVHAGVVAKQCKLDQPLVSPTVQPVVERRSRRIKLTPLERGWSGGKMGGRKIGPPDPIGEDTFEGFETWILEGKYLTIMTGNMGRKQRSSVFVITGNGQGLAGISVGRAQDVKAAMKLAKNRAALRLIYLPRDDHTVIHDFFTQFGNTKIFVKKMYPGYGLVCHRAIKCCCEAIGIKDLYAKVEGSTNVQHIAKAFLIGLLRQKSYQTMANEMKLHVVEMRKENGFFPKVVASPAVVRKPEEVTSTEILDFKQYVMDGRVVREKPKIKPFYMKLDSWQFHLKKQERWRDQNNVRIRLSVEYGEVRSFLTDEYPEAKPRGYRKKREEQNE